jgi:hypothetical protein
MFAKVRGTTGACVEVPQGVKMVTQVVSFRLSDQEIELVKQHAKSPGENHYLYSKDSASALRRLTPPRNPATGLPRLPSVFVKFLDLKLVVKDY